MDTTILLYAVRYAIGRQNMELPKVAKYINDNIYDIPGYVLKDIYQELNEYYSTHTDDKNCLLAKIILTQINQELYGGDEIAR